jgi:photoactive yellow protein
MTEQINAVPDFEEPHLAAAVEKLSPDQVHALPYGAIQLDSSGQAIFYSDAERRQSGYRKTVLGRDFFFEIAPCMNNRVFAVASIARSPPGGLISSLTISPTCLQAQPIRHRCLVHCRKSPSQGI